MGDIAFTEYVPDIVPDPKAGPAVARYRMSGPGSTLLGQGAVGQVVLAEHLDMDAELLGWREPPQGCGGVSR